MNWLGSTVLGLGHHGTQCKQQKHERSWFGTRGSACSGVIIPNSTGKGRFEACSSKFNIHTGILGILIKWRFWFRRSGSELRHCISNKLQASVEVTGHWITLNNQGHKSSWLGHKPVPIGFFLADSSFESLWSVSLVGSSSVHDWPGNDCQWGILGYDHILESDITNNLTPWRLGIVFPLQWWT